MKRVLLSALLLLTLAATASLGWLLGTESGLRWIYQQVESTLAGRLQAEQVSGSLGAGVTLQGLSFEDDSVSLSVDRGVLQWNPWALLSARIDITSLVIGELDVRLLPSPQEQPTESSGAAALPALQLPLEIRIGELLIERARFSQNNRPLQLQQLRLQAAASAGRIHIDSLTLGIVEVAIDANHSSDFEIRIAGDIDTANDYASQLQIDWQTRLPSGSEIDNSARIDGDLSSVRITQQTRGALQADLALQLSEPLEQLGWQLDLKVSSFDSTLLNAELPAVSGGLELSAIGDLTRAEVSGRVDADSTDYGKIDARFELRSLEPARLTEGVSIESLQLGVFGEALRASGQLHWAPVPSWNIAVTASDLNPASLLPEWPGKLSARLQTEGRYENEKMLASASIEEVQGSLRGYPLTLRGELHWRDDTLEIESASLTSGNTHVQAQGRAGKALDIDWSLQSDDLAELYPEARGRLSASGHLGGEREAPVVEARFNGGALRLDDYAIASIDGDVAIDLQNWKQLDIRLRASELSLQGQSLQSLEIDADSRRIRAVLKAAEVAARLELAGEIHDRGWRGKLVSADIDSAEFSSWRLQAPVELGIDNDSIAIGRLCMLSELQAEACSSLQRTDQGWDIDLQLARFPLRLLHRWTPPELGLDGTANVTADLQYANQGRLLGTVAAEFPQATASYPLQPDKPERFDYRRGELKLSLLPQQIEATATLTLQNGDRLQGSLTMPGADLLQFDIDRQIIRGEVRVDARDWGVVDAMLPQIEDLRGDLRFDIDISGSLGQPRLQGDARLDGGAFKLRDLDYSFEQIVLSAQSDGSDRLNYSVDAVAASGKISLRGDTLLDRQAGWPSELSLQGDGFDLAQLLAPWLAPPLAVEGLMQASAELSFRAPDQLFGEASFSAPQGRLIYPLVAQEMEQWDYRDAQLTLTLNEAGISARSAISIGRDNTISAEMFLSQARLLALDPDAQPLEALAQVNFVELDLIQYLVPEIDEVQGQLALELTVDGSLAQPRLRARSEIQQASLRVPRLGLEIREINLQGSSDEQDLFNFELSALSGDGKLTIKGSSQLDPSQGWPTRIHVNGDNFEVSRIPEALVTASPDLEVSIEARRIRIEGDLLLPFARLQPRDISSAATVSSDAVVIGQEQPEEEQWLITTRVNLTLGERVTFYGFGFEGKLGGRLLVEDKPGEPSTGTGEITINEGRYRAYGQRLDINNGRLLFTGGVLDNPGLDLRAVRQVDDVTVGLQVRGRLNKPEVELFSIPTMDQTNMLSYLLLGRPMDSATGTEGEMMAKAALALGLAGGDNLARRLGDRFGFDEMRIESGNDGDQASLVVGRYLSPKLYVSYGVGLIESINTINLRYKLTERWRLEAESGEDQGADLLFSIER